jgi:hypothetical protein
MAEDRYIDKKYIPNQAGFTFIARLWSGEEKLLTVRKNRQYYLEGCQWPDLRDWRYLDADEIGSMEG